MTHPYFYRFFDKKFLALLDKWCTLKGSLPQFDIVMSYLARSCLWIFSFIGIVLGGVGFLFESITHILSQNYMLNGVIFLTIFCGIFFVFIQMYQLYREHVWLDYYEQGKENFPGVPRPKILAPLSSALTQGCDSLSPVNARGVLSSIEGRLDDMREVNRYLIGLLIFLGLLGTFWGLSKTISAITQVIGGIDIAAQDVKDAMNNLKQGLAQPLGGMGTAFSCSLFGLSGSLILGFLDLQVGRSCSRFFKHLEERLSLCIRGKESFMQVTSNGPAFSQGLLEQTIETMASLQIQVKRGEENRIGLIKSTQILSENLIRMTEQMATHQSIVKKIAQNQIDLQDHMKYIANSVSHHDHFDSITLGLKNMESILSKVLEELVEGRGRMTQDIRSEIRMIAKTLSALASQEFAA